MDDEEELEELEDELEELKEKLEAIEEQVAQIEDASEEKDYHQITTRDRPFVLHYIAGYDGGFVVDSKNTARAAFWKAVEAKKDSTAPVEHGDVMVIPLECPWYGMYVERGDDYQKIGLGDSGDSRDIVVWVGCHQSCECDPTQSISELGTSWAVSIANSCVLFNNTMSISIYSSDSEGTTLLAKTRAFTLNKCGEIINIGAESEHQLLIPCCSPWDESLCEDGFLDNYTLTEPDGSTHTLTRTPSTNSYGTVVNCISWYSPTDSNGNYSWVLTKTLTSTPSFSLSGNLLNNDGCPCVNGNNASKPSSGDSSIPTGTYECPGNAGDPAGTVATIS